MSMEGQTVVQVKRRKDEIAVTNLRKPIDTDKGQEHGLEDGVTCVAPFPCL